MMIFWRHISFATPPPPITFFHLRFHVLFATYMPPRYACYDFFIRTFALRHAMLTILLHVIDTCLPFHITFCHFHADCRFIYAEREPKTYDDLRLCAADDCRRDLLIDAVLFALMHYESARADTSR
jgi:hypothetical protein